MRPPYASNNSPTPSGKFLLDLDNQTITELLRGISRSQSAVLLKNLLKPAASLSGATIPVKLKGLSCSFTASTLH